MKVLHTTGRGSRKTWESIAALENRRNTVDESVIFVTRRIIDGVRKGGDAALRGYVERLDKISKQTQLQIAEEEMQQAWKDVSPAFKKAIEAAAKNIRRFAKKQLPQDWDFSPVDGLQVGQRIRPLASVGCYVPSGRYPLPSTLLMTAIPAQVAGVPRIVVVSPHPVKETLAAAAYIGVKEFYRIGGAQAIAALAYGTETLPRVDKIVGPGNAYVTAAKKLVSFDCAIDMLAGPTEIVIASETGNAAGIAADLVAQAEHDPDALAVFITTKGTLATKVSDEVKERVRTNSIAKQSIQRNGVIFVAGTVAEAREITNRLAPEHLSVDAEEDLKWAQNAGSVFIGEYSAQPMGDYISGPNHTLPTGGLARVRGGLSVADFLKAITVQTYKRKGMKRLGPLAITLAEAEGLQGHAEAIRVRGGHA